jgi:VWFA-related protein
MIRFLKAMPQGEHLALFILGTDLRMVQGFTDNPASLAQAAERTARDISPLFTTEAQKQQDAGFTEEIGRHAFPAIANAPSDVQSRLAATEADSENFIGSVSQRNASRAAMEGTLTDQRTTMTLDALSAIARTVAGYPGRKNMLWLSGSFQIRLRPSENSFLTIGSRTSQAANPVSDLTNTATYQAAIRQVSTSLAAARLAVYPIDIRGIQNGGVDLTVGSDQSRVMANSEAPDAFGKTLMQQSETRFNERSSMEDLADQTGGQVFLNNDIRGSIQRSLEDGANYYTLAYTPEKNGGSDSKFRRVEIKLNQGGLKLAYRPGYYPISTQDSLKQSGARKLAAAMQPGLPPSTMLVLTAKVLPPDASSKTVRIDYSIDTAGVVFTGTTNQNQRTVLDCMTVALDQKGAIAGQVANTMDAQIPSDQFGGFQRTGLPLHQELTLPPGTYDLRLGVMDRASQRVGTLGVVLVIPELDAAKQ